MLHSSMHSPQCAHRGVLCIFPDELNFPIYWLDVSCDGFYFLILTHMSSRLLCQLAVPFPRVLFNMFAVSRGVSSMEFGDLEALCKAVVKEKQPFERLEVSKETLLKMFKVSERGKTGVFCFCLDLYILLTPTVSIFQYNKFKCRILNEKVTTPTTTVYR